MAVTGVTEHVGNYVDGLYYGTHDSSGYLVGSTTTAPVAGSQDGSMLARLQGVQSFPFGLLPAERPSQPGDGGVIARFLNRSTELPDATLTLGAANFDFDALAESSAVVTVGGGRFIGRQGYNPTYSDLILLCVAAAKSIESGNTGGMWEARLVYSANAQSRGRNSFDTGSLPSYEVDVIGNYASAYPWGTAFVSGTDGDDQFVVVDFTWPYRPILERWTGDGSETTFNLGQNIAEDSSDNIAVYGNGTALTWVTGVPSAGEFGVTESTTDTIVCGTAPASAAKVVALYGWS